MRGIGAEATAGAGVGQKSEVEGGNNLDGALAHLLTSSAGLMSYRVSTEN